MITYQICLTDASDWAPDRSPCFAVAAAAASVVVVAAVDSSHYLRRRTVAWDAAIAAVEEVLHCWMRS